jgi:hypothetical protein
MTNQHNKLVSIDTAEDHVIQMIMNLENWLAQSLRSSNANNRIFAKKIKKT